MACTDQTVLAFCRPYLVDDFRMMLTPVSDRFEVHYLTDGRNTAGVPDTRAAFYAAHREGSRCDALNVAQTDDIIDRCRMLRCLPRAEAEDLVHAAGIALVKALDETQPDLVFCHIVDEYITHILCVLAENRDIPYLAYYAAYFPDLVNLTLGAHGKPVLFRTPKQEQIDKMLALVSPKEFRADYKIRLNFSVWSHLRGTLRYYAKRVYFEFKRHAERDPLNMHYRITPYLAEKKSFFDYARSGDYTDDWRVDLDELRQTAQGPRTTVYMPLSFYPEASTNYWVRNRKMLEFDDCTLDIIRRLSKDHHVLVKEHAHMLGIRDRGFLRQLREIPNVISVNPMEKSNFVLEEADVALVGAGSVGPEATLRGKPVISYSDTCYWFEASGATFLDLDDLSGIHETVQRAIDGFKPLDEAGKHAFVENCLAGTAHVRPGGKRWPIIDADDVASVFNHVLSET